MDTSVLSLIVAAIAVFFGPVISWMIAKRQINISSELAKVQIGSSLLTANKQIIAPMRQAWINNLRDLVAELSSSSLHYYVSGYEDRTDQEYQRMTLLEAKIKMMLNPDEKDHQRLEELIRNLISSLERGTKNADNFPDCHTQVVSLSRVIFKREWNRVKEPITTSSGDA